MALKSRVIPVLVPFQLIPTKPGHQHRGRSCHPITRGTSLQIVGTALAALVMGIGRPVGGAEVDGRVVGKGRGSGAQVTTVVYLLSLSGRTPVHPGRYRLAQKDKSFVPRVLAVPVGSTVDFPNEDPIFHNVFSLSPPAPFDLGLYRAGGSKSRVFPEPATYRVFCNIHPQMTATILVLPTSYITEADSSGAYQVEVTPGKYRVVVWSERSQPASAEITVDSSAVTVPTLTLDESRFVAMPHPNKYGQPYPAAGYNPLEERRH